MGFMLLCFQLWFQSTLPMKGATFAFSAISCAIAVSIHAPNEGSDPEQDRESYNDIPVSIHAPNEGSDLVITSTRATPSCFNPRSQ